MKLITRHDALRTIYLENGTAMVLPPARNLDIKETVVNACFDENDELLTQLRETLIQSFQTKNEWPLFDWMFIKYHDCVRIYFAFKLVVMDGFSAEIVAADLAKLFIRPDMELPILENTLAEYLTRLQEEKNTNGYKRAEKYWKSKAPELKPSPQLPLLRSNTSERQIPLDRLEHRIPSDKWNTLQSIARGKKCTPSVILLALFANILERWSTKPEFTLNVMIGMRDYAGMNLQGVVGNFSSTLLLPVPKLMNLTFGQQVGHLQQELFMGMLHRQFSGVATIREINRTERGNSAPRMPIVFASMLGGSDESVNLGLFESMGWVQKVNILNTPQVTLDHQVYEHNGDLVLAWNYSNRRFPEGMLSDMFQSYSRLVEAYCSENMDWSHKVQIPLPPRQQSVREKVCEVGPLPTQRTLLSGFMEQVALNPENTAVVDGDVNVSYRYLYECALRIAGGLHAPERKHIAVSMERGWQQVAATLGVLFSGHPYLPISFGNPIERTEKILNKSETNMVITDSSTVHNFSHLKSTEVLVFDDLMRGRIDSTTVNLPTGNEVAYTIFTSGSTGEPKGVTILHHSVMNTIDDIISRFGLSGSDRVFAVSDLAFDLSVFDIFGMLAIGGGIVTPKERFLREPEILVKLIIENDVTIWNSVPAYMELLSTFTVHSEDKLLPLKTVMMSGDWIPINLPAKIKEFCPEAKIISLGGATEASIWSNYYVIEKVPTNWASIPYGFPLKNQQLHVLNELFEDCPDWVDGEIYISGAGVAQGYMNDTEKTSASFIPDAIQGKKLYRTGDWGRFWPTGWIEFLGRQDLQIKVGGFRIEIGEIEAALLNHKDVAEAVVVDKELTDKKKYLVAFYTVKNKKHCSSETVRKKLEESLPHYMIPAAFIQLEHLPKNINGKIDRKALRNTNHSLSPNPTSHSNRKLTKMEHIVAEQWEKALGQKVGSPEDDFFALGGDSINALHVILGLENDLAKSIDIRLLYENPLLNEFSLALMNSAEDDKDSFTRLNRSSSHETLYCIHPIGGGVLGYKEVAKHLEKDFSVLGLAMSYKSRYPECPLEELTQHYIKRILETNPKQPVKLLGWSMGGLISYELARQLNSLGISTKLILIDTWVSKGSSAMRQTPRKILEGFVYDLYEGAIPKEPNDILRNEDVHTIGKFVEYANRMNFNLPIPPRHIEQLFGIYEANLHRIINYPYPGHISNMLFLDATQRNQVFSAFLTPMTDSKQWKNAFIDNSLEKYEKNHYSICKDLDDGKLVSQVTKWLS